MLAANDMGGKLSFTSIYSYCFSQYYYYRMTAAFFPLFFFVCLLSCWENGAVAPIKGCTQYSNLFHSESKELAIIEKELNMETFFTILRLLFEICVENQFQ